MHHYHWIATNGSVTTYGHVFEHHHKLIERPNSIMQIHNWNFVSDIYIFIKLIPTFGNRCLSAIGGGKQRSRLAGWVQLTAEAAPAAPTE